MDILNFISWIKGKRLVTTVDPAKTLLPVALKDGRRDDDYLTGAITVEDFAAAVADPSVTFVQGSLEPNVQATMTPIGGTITRSTGVVLKRYRIQGIADLAGSSSYALLIGVVSGSNTSLRVREDSVILAQNNLYDTVASAMNFNVLVADNAGNLLSTTTAFIADDNTISTIKDHWYTLVMTAAATFKAQVQIDFTIAIPETETVEFFN